MSFLMMIIAATGVGLLAQRRGHTGAVWGLISLLIMIPVWNIIYHSTAMVQPSLYSTDEGWYALGLIVAGGVGIIMAIVVSILPRKAREPAQAGIQKCYWCGEEIKKEDKYCPCLDRYTGNLA